MTYIVRDGQVFYTAEGYWREYPVDAAEAETFEARGEHHARDASRAYFQNRPIPSADPATFESLDDEFSRDQSCVFCQTLRVEGADAPTFECLGQGFARDEHQFFEGPSGRSEPPSFFEKDRVVQAEEDPTSRWKTAIEAGDTNALDQLIDWYGEDENFLEAHVWMHVAVELRHKLDLYTETIEALEGQELSSVDVNVKVFVVPIETVCVVLSIPLITGG